MTLAFVLHCSLNHDSFVHFIEHRVGGVGGHHAVDAGKPVPVRSMLKMGLRWIEALQVGEGGAGVPVDVEGALL